MKLVELVNTLDLTVAAAKDHLDTEVTGGYASDLLSDVIAHGQVGNIWITLQIHVNIVAVASLKDMAGVVLINGRQPDADTVQRADAEGIPILTSKLPMFELVGRLYELGIRGEGMDRASEAVKS